MGELESKLPIASKEGNINFLKTILGIGLIAVAAHVLLGAIAKGKFFN